MGGNHNVPLLRRERNALSELDGASLVQLGLLETGARFTFQCPICQKFERNDQRMEPMCTGPGWTDDHPPEIMLMVKQDEKPIALPSEFVAKAILL